METLNLKEHRAIEYRYLGMPHDEIAEKIEVPKETLDGWFKKRGRLSPFYKEWATEMDKKRSEYLLNRLHVQDEEILRITTLIIRTIGQRILEGKYIPKISDLVRVWKIQRVMRGLPTNITQSKCKHGHNSVLHLS